MGDTLPPWGRAAAARTGSPNVGGKQLICFADSTKSVPITELELRQCQRARARDHIRATVLRSCLYTIRAEPELLEIIHIALGLLA